MAGGYKMGASDVTEAEWRHGPGRALVTHPDIWVSPRLGSTFRWLHTARASGLLDSSPGCS